MRFTSKILCLWSMSTRNLVTVVQLPVAHAYYIYNQGNKRRYMIC